MSIKIYGDMINKAIEYIQRKIVGKRKEVELILATLLAEGHALLEGVPGVAKTLIAKLIAAVLGLDFKRIQATPDLLPYDILGSQIYDAKTSQFIFRKGPIFTNILLIDEINRASPKTQSALLEAMQERQVTIEGISHKLPRPFLVIATMNPIEVEGTFPLSEAQIDRFLAKIIIDYPSIEETIEILNRYYDLMVFEDITPILTISDILKMIDAVREVYVEENIKKYIVYIVEATRKHPMVKLGVSPRGAIALYLLSKSIALIRGRDYVTPDDVKYVALVALSHRIILRGEAKISGITTSDVVNDVLTKVEPP